MIRLALSLMAALLIAMSHMTYAILIDRRMVHLRNLGFPDTWRSC